MTQAGYLSSHFHDLVASVVTARAIDVRGDPNLFGALVGRMLPIRSRLFVRQLLLIRGSSEGWAVPLSTHLLVPEHACYISSLACDARQDHGSGLTMSIWGGKRCNRGY